MRIDGPTSVKKGLVFPNLGQGLPQKKLAFFQIFEPILRAGFLTEC